MRKEMRVCKICNEKKPISAFGVIYNTYTSRVTGETRTKASHRYRCIKCGNNTWGKNYVKKNKEKYYSYIYKWEAQQRELDTDHYIKKQVCRKNIKFKDVTPEMIILQRKINSIENEKGKQGSRKNNKK